MAISVKVIGSHNGSPHRWRVLVCSLIKRSASTIRLIFFHALPLPAFHLSQLSSEVFGAGALLSENLSWGIQQWEASSPWRIPLRKLLVILLLCARFNDRSGRPAENPRPSFNYAQISLQFLPMTILHVGARTSLIQNHKLISFLQK